MTDPDSPPTTDWLAYYQNRMQAPPPQKPSIPRGKVTLAIVVLTTSLLVGSLVLTLALRLTAPTGERPAALEMYTPTPSSRKITVVIPDTFGGRPKNTDSELNQGVSQRIAEVQKEPWVTDAVQAYYGSVATKNFAFVAAARVTKSYRNFDALIRRTIDYADFDMVKLAEVDAGPLGGRAMCGDITSGRVRMAICAWQDEGSFGLIGWRDVSVEQAQPEFHALRASVEQVG